MQRKIFASDKIRLQLEQLYGRNEGRKKYLELIRKKRRYFILIMIITVLMSLLLYIRERQEADIPIAGIERNESGGGDKNISLTAVIKDREEAITFTVDEQNYSYEELSSYAERAEEELNEIILCDNKSLDEVTSDLNLTTSLDDCPFDISWKTDKPLLLSKSGKIDKTRLKKELSQSENGEILVNVSAELKYGDFLQDIYYPVRLIQDKEISYEELVNDVTSELKASEEADRENKYVAFPDKVDGVDITYRKSSRKEWLIILIVGTVCAVGLCISKDKEIDEAVKKRDAELARDYSKILNQYVLYLYSGMSHRMIWENICSRYEKKVKRTGEKRAAYEEMLITRRNLEDGVGEVAAYEAFARRCRIGHYRVFVNLIEQSVRKGGESLSGLLEEEIEKSHREDNNRARGDIQEISTKLLLPMMMMLVIVLVIVMVPAFISFNN